MEHYIKRLNDLRGEIIADILEFFSDGKEIIFTEDETSGLYIEESEVTKMDIIGVDLEPTGFMEYVGQKYEDLGIYDLIEILEFLNSYSKR